MRRKNYIKKTKIISDNNFLNLFLILKNSRNFLFFKKMKFLEKKNLFVNYYFYNFFKKNYKNNNLKYFSKNFNFNKNIFIFNKNNFKNQFIFNNSFLKSFITYNEKLLFFKNHNKLNNFDKHMYNCYVINSNKNYFIKNIEFQENFIVLNNSNLYNNNNNINNLIYFNFNMYIFNNVEIYKFLIFIWLYKIIIKYI